MPNNDNGPFIGQIAAQLTEISNNALQFTEGRAKGYRCYRRYTRGKINNQKVVRLEIDKRDGWRAQISIEKPDEYRDFVDGLTNVFDGTKNVVVAYKGSTIPAAVVRKSRGNIIEYHTAIMDMSFVIWWHPEPVRQYNTQIIACHMVEKAQNISAWCYIAIQLLEQTCLEHLRRKFHCDATMLPDIKFT